MRCLPEGPIGVSRRAVGRIAVEAPRPVRGPGPADAVPPGASVRARRRATRLREGALTPWLFLAPGLLLFVGSRVYPLLDGLYLSFTNATRAFSARLGRRIADVNASLAAVEAAGASTGEQANRPVVPDAVALG